MLDSGALSCAAKMSPSSSAAAVNVTETPVSTDALRSATTAIAWDCPDRWYGSRTILSASTTAGQSFVDRQKYQDALKARGLGVPERAQWGG